MHTKLIIKNRKAWHEYEILEKYEAGIVLRGSETKSLRAGQVKITDSFCQITDQMELEVHQLHISPYHFATHFNHELTRRRKLLMHKKEILRLYKKVREKGLSIIPLTLYFKKNYIKMEIALARGKKLHDKRQSIKEKDIQRDVDRAIKNT